MKTVNKLIDGFIDLQKSLGIIGENEKDTYIYAYTILFEQVLNIFIAIVIGSMMGALGFVGVFLLFLYSVTNFGAVAIMLIQGVNAVYFRQLLYF